MSIGEQHTTQMVDRLFRQTSGKMVAILSQCFGLAHLSLVEDVVQESFMQALQSWKHNGYPENPEAWLMQTARNRAIDRFRKHKIHHEYLQHTATSEGSEAEPAYHHQEIADSRLRMIFACCHPTLSLEDQIALTLRTVFSFSSAEIAKALLTKEATIQKRLLRARNKLREENVLLEIPAGKQLEQRLDAALAVLYLLFNEGYYSPGKDEDIRYELCVEAIQSGKLLAEHPLTAQPATLSLLALMCLHAARFNSRNGNPESIVLLHEQDRSLWDRELMQVGIYYLNKATTCTLVSQYQIEAVIAVEYCMAPSFEETNWKRLLQHYNLLLQLNHSPHVMLSRAVVMEKNGLAHEAIASILSLNGIEHLLQTNHLYSAVLGNLYLSLCNKMKAGEYLQRAHQLSPSSLEKRLLQERLETLHKN